MTDHIRNLAAAMRAGNFLTFGEFLDAAVAAGFHDNENIDLAGFVDSINKKEGK